MTFKDIFDGLCRDYTKKPARFISVTEKTFKQITARKLMNNCLESKHEVILTAFTDYGNAKVADFYTSFTDSESDPINGTKFHEQNFMIVFVMD